MRDWLFHRGIPTLVLVSFYATLVWIGVLFWKERAKDDGD